MACTSLVARLQPIATKLQEEGKPTTWSAIVARSFMMSWLAPLVQLQTIDQYGANVPGQGPQERLRYCVYGAAVSEVELDVLTGERHIVRSDILFDVGKSMNPGVDMGQIEGAFVMVRVVRGMVLLDVYSGVYCRCYWTLLRIYLCFGTHTSHALHAPGMWHGVDRGGCV